MKWERITLITVIGAGVFLATPVLANEMGELVTDRPDATESSSTVAPGYIQFEAGFTHFEDSDQGEGVEGHGVPESLLRIGLADDWELRLAYSGYQWERTHSSGGSTNKSEGSADTEIGFKVRLAQEDGVMPEIAFLSHLSLPVGKSPFTSHRPDPMYRLAFSHTLSEKYSLGYNLGQVWATEEDAVGDRDTRSIFQYTIALGVAIDETTGMFLEFFGDIATGSGGGGPANTFDGGFTWLLADNLQLDLVAGSGLSNSADDWFIGTGVSIRLPN
jgi:hypothetical protein